MRSAYKCHGITIWQNNGAASIQTVWHYHTHVIPRYDGDSYFDSLLDMDKTLTIMKPSERVKYAEKLRNELAAVIENR